jgi:hypothetical protein
MFTLKAKNERHVVATALRRLEGSVPTLETITVGVDTLSSPRAVDVCLITTFDTLKGFEQYQTHPEHVKILKFIEPMVEKSEVGDWFASS